MVSQNKLFVNCWPCGWLLLAAATFLLATGNLPAAEEPVDVATVERIKAEARDHSQVMEIASWLTDVYGPRLTGSPHTQAAAEWAVATMKSWGLANARLEQWNPYESGVASDRWGPLDRGWTNEQFTFRAVEPRPFVIHAVPTVWSPSTQGRVGGPAIRFDVHSFDDMQRFAGKLKNAFLLVDSPVATPAHFEPRARRLTDAELEALSAGRTYPGKPRELEGRHYNVTETARSRRWLAGEGVAALLFTSPGGWDAIALAGPGGANPRKKESDELPSVRVSAESYGRIFRILEKDIPVTLELEMQNTFYDRPKASNVLAEIPGTDPRLKDELVMIGAHLDSWTYGTGATDNGAGVAVMMEALRILKVLDLKPRRTIRIGLWTGEEQGALGSNAYVQRHFDDWFRRSLGDAATKPEYELLSVYFNLDSGTGKIRGVYQQGNQAVRPIFSAWIEPFRESGMTTVSPFNIGGGDNTAFDRVGLPSFGFVQDPIEYTTRTYHSSADVFERLQPDDMRYNAAVLASFAWLAAQRDEKLPKRSP